MRLKTLDTFKFSALAALLAAVQPVLAEAPATLPLAEVRVDVSRYVVDGDNPLPPAEVEGVLASHLGLQRSLDQLEAAAAALEKSLREAGYAFHRVVIPAQKPADGVIRLQVLSFSLGRTEIAGNQHFSSDNIRASLPGLAGGQPLDVGGISEDLAAANTNPAKQTRLTFTEGREQGTVDAQLQVIDSNPLTYFVGLTGNLTADSHDTGNDIRRMMIGFQHANLFDRDHVLTLSYTTDPIEPSDTSLVSGFYQFPIYGYGLSVATYYTQSDVDSGRVPQGGGVFDVSGRGRFFGVRLTKSLPRLGQIQQALSLALDYRLFENNTTFGGVQIQPDVGSAPLTVRYEAKSTSGGDLSWGASFEHAKNLHYGARNDGLAHAANGGENDWSAWRYAISGASRLGDWAVSGKLRGQWSGDALIAGEQFGLGGANSVRGFRDREISGDSGYQWSLEGVGPVIATIGVAPVLFLEGGGVRQRLANADERLMSIGAGLRWSSRAAEIAFDLARPLDRNSQHADDSSLRAHLTMLYRF